MAYWCFYWLQQRNPLKVTLIKKLSSLVQLLHSFNSQMNQTDRETIEEAWVEKWKSQNCSCQALPAKNIRKLFLYLILDRRTGPLATVSRNAPSRNEHVSTWQGRRAYMSCQAITKLQAGYRRWCQRPGAARSNVLCPQEWCFFSRAQHMMLLRFWKGPLMLLGGWGEGGRREREGGRARTMAH